MGGPSPRELDRTWLARGRRGLPGLDLRSIGLFRIALGLLMVLDLVQYRLPYVAAFYSERGIVDRALLAALWGTGSDWLNGPGPGLLTPLAGEAAVTGFFVAALLLALAFTAGFRSRVCGALLLAVFWSIHHRNPVVVEMDDRLLACFLFWGLFLPLDARLSAHATGERGATFRGAAATAIVLQIVCIYVPNALFKTGPCWRDGTAIAYALQDCMWARPGPAAWLAQFPRLCAALTYSVRPLEAAIPVLILWPSAKGATRAAAVALMLTLHWGICVFFAFGHLPHVLTVGALVLLPAQFWEAVRPLADRVGLLHPRVVPDGASDVARGAMERLGRAGAAAALVALVGLNLLYPEAVRESPRLPAGLRAVLARLRRSPLTMQHWALYVPDPTDEVGILKIRGVPAAGPPIDLWTGEVFRADGTGADAYQVDPWQNVAVYFLYDEPHGRDVIQRWTRFEYERARRRPRGAYQGAYQRVEAVALRRTILSADRAGPWVAEVVATTSASGVSPGGEAPR